MKDLNLTVTRDYFELIAQEIKTEEYREIKPYWQKRLTGSLYYYQPDQLFDGARVPYSHFDRVCFRNGYDPFAPWCACKYNGLTIKKLTEEDHCPEEWIGKLVYCLHLGEVLETAYFYCQ